MTKFLLSSLIFLSLSVIPYAVLWGQAETSPQESASGGPSQEYQNSLGMKFVLVSSGTFLMGAGVYDQHVFDHERPQHKVSITKPFYAGTTEVTQGEWQELMGNNPSRFVNPLNPVEQVSYQDAESFIDKLNQKEGTKAYRLPTEAEWEYFARAGTISPYFFGDVSDSLSKYAWYNENSKNQTHPAGGLLANPWGLFDVYGNVSEMLSDWFALDYYSVSPPIDPTGPESGKDRVLRGGNFNNASYGNRSSFRDHFEPLYKESVIGFRLIMDIPDEGSVAKR